MWSWSCRGPAATTATGAGAGEGAGAGAGAGARLPNCSMSAWREEKSIDCVGSSDGGGRVLAQRERGARRGLEPDRDRALAQVVEVVHIAPLVEVRVLVLDGERLHALQPRRAPHRGEEAVDVRRLDRRRVLLREERARDQQVVAHHGRPAVDACPVRSSAGYFTQDA